jgi:hypothetical protein
MKRGKKKHEHSKITVKDYVKAVKKADREIEQSIRPGWSSTTKIHKNKKAYSRQENKRVEE